jgi:kynureninase
MALAVADLAQHPNPLSAHYRRFCVAERVLLTGHSHQAWPDVAREGLLRAFDDAAHEIDKKWQRAFVVAERVQRGFARLLGDPGSDSGADLALGASTHDLLIRWLSALPLRQKPRLVTTDGEFHSIRRQLDRLEEEGLEIVRIASAEPATLAERLAVALDEQTAAVLVSSVLFRSARLVPHLDQLAAAAERRGVELLVDTYHHLNVVPMTLAGLENAWIVGGGYKYCQLGEGNCFLRVPPGRDLRPVVTGWFAEFADLAAAPKGWIGYGRGALAFAGATYDPTSNYRAAAVFDFFEDQGLTPELLRAISQHQVSRLAEAFDGLDLDPAIIRRPQVATAALGGFLVLSCAAAEEIAAALRRLEVHVDARGDALRLGPAPYLSDRQLDDAVAALEAVVGSRRRAP